MDIKRNVSDNMTKQLGRLSINNNTLLSTDETLLLQNLDNIDQNCVLTDACVAHKILFRKHKTKKWATLSLNKTSKYNAFSDSESGTDYEIENESDSENSKNQGHKFKSCKRKKLNVTLKTPNKGTSRYKKLRAVKHRTSQKQSESSSSNANKCINDFLTEEDLKNDDLLHDSFEYFEDTQTLVNQNENLQKLKKNINPQKNSNENTNTFLKPIKANKENVFDIPLTCDISNFNWLEDTQTFIDNVTKAEDKKIVNKEETKTTTSSSIQSSTKILNNNVFKKPPNSKIKESFMTVTNNNIESFKTPSANTFEDESPTTFPPNPVSGHLNPKGNLPVAESMAKKTIEILPSRSAEKLPQNLEFEIASEDFFASSSEKLFSSYFSQPKTSNPKSSDSSKSNLQNSKIIDRKVDSTVESSMKQSQFSQFCKDSQFLLEIENAILKGDELNKSLNKSEENNFSYLENEGNKIRANDDNKQQCSKNEKNGNEANLESQSVENLSSEKFWNETMNGEMSQLFKSTEYRKQVDLLFEHVETSICQMGPNQDKTLLKDTTLTATEQTFKSPESTKLLQTIANIIKSPENVGETMNNIDWPDDTSITNAILNITSGQNEMTFGEIIKKALVENAKKPVKPSNLINCTLESNESEFKVLGSFYGLPNKVRDLMKLYKGIEKLYDWQDECLNLPAVKARKNLVYALPTSGGKTLVAEILILREILCRNRNVIFVLPYVSIVQEKVWALSPFGVALDFLIEEYAAGKGNFPPRKRRRKNSVYIATMEKALGIVNSLIENNRLDELGLVVVDELHLIGDQSRGATLESLLTKLMYLKQNVQIVGMSATIGNLKEICEFLEAEVYTQNFRPVELVEYVKCGNEIAKINWQAQSSEELLTLDRKITFPYPESLSKIDPDRLGGLVLEVVPKASCLIFCSTKKNCENVAYLLCKVMFPKLKEHKREEKERLLQNLKDETTVLCNVLNVSIPFGVAYHHSGLTSEERKLIEEAFREGVISVICCTSTLAAGVNLPAKRVILRQPYIGRDFINLSRYKQMVGRAGRTGFGESGESILICNQQELPKVRELLISPMDLSVSSMIEYDCRGLKHLILSCISLNLANTRPQLQKIVSKSLLAVQQNRLNVDIKKCTDEVIVHLFKVGALQPPGSEGNSSGSSLSSMSVQMNTSSVLGTPPTTSDPSTSKPKVRVSVNNDTKLIISKLGSASIKAGLDLSKAHVLYEDLLQAQASLVLLDCLHLLYLVTPYDVSEQVFPTKSLYYTIFTQLNPRERQTAKVLGLTESCAVRMLTNQPIKAVPERVLNRFYVTLMLYDLWNEERVYQVSEKYQVNRGLIQNLMTSAATFASNVVNFCNELEEFWAFAHLLGGMSKRLSHCCVKELIPLMELPAVKQNRARELYNAGYKNLQSIAKADPNDLIRNIEYMSRKLANQLIAAAKLLLLEKVENLREEAEDVLDGIEKENTVLY